MIEIIVNIIIMYSLFLYCFKNVVYVNNNYREKQEERASIKKINQIRSDHLTIWSNQKDWFLLLCFAWRLILFKYKKGRLKMRKWWHCQKRNGVDNNEKQIQLLCAPAFNLPLPKQIARQSACLIKFYEMFKTTLCLNS